MFKKIKDHIILNRCESYSINKKTKFKKLDIEKQIPHYTKESKYLSIENIQSPVKRHQLIEEKSQKNSMTRKIKISLNKYHKYIKNIENKGHNKNIRPFSLYINKNKRNNNNNNREEIGKNYSSLSRNKFFSGMFHSNSNSFKERTILSSTQDKRKKLNLLNIGINSPINKNSKIFNSFNSHNDNNIVFNGIKSAFNKNIDSLALNEKLKNSKFFNKTKYIHGIKNRNLKKSKIPSISTHNIYLEQNQDDLIYNTINEIIIKKLINHNSKMIEKKDINVIKTNNVINKNDENYQIEKAKYFDLLPIILNHIKQKKETNDIYKEYNNYLSNISENTSNNNIINNKKKNPIIRYLFLENIINNLKHLVKFINIQSKEEIEQNVIKVIGEEYSKFEENNMNNNNDFLTFGFEFIPKSINKNYKILIDKGLQTSKFSHQKSIFFINEKIIEEKSNNNTITNNEVMSPKRKIFLRNSLSNRRKIDFEIKKFDEKKKLKEEIKNELNEVFSNFPLPKKEQKTKERKNELYKSSEIKNLKIIDKKSPKKRSAKMIKRTNNPKFIKINLNKLKINEIMKQNNNKGLDSTDKMKNIPSLERLNKQEKKEENKNIKKEENKNKNKKIITHKPSLKNDLLAKKIYEKRNTLEIKNNIKKIENEKENENVNENENEEESQENSEEVNCDNEIISKELYDKLKKTSKFTRKYKKALKEKKKMEKVYKETLENNEIAIREIRKMEKKKKKVSRKKVFNELMYQNKRKSMLSTNENNNNKDKNDEDNYSSISSSEMNLQIEGLKQFKSEENNDIEDSNKKKEDESILSSVSEIQNELEEFNEVKEIVKPKTKKEAFDEERRKLTYRRRGGVVIPSPEIFKNIIKNKELSDLNDKMKKIYDNIYKQKKREENQKRRKKKKHYIYSFNGVDLNNIKEVEIRKKVHLNRIKGDIKYKINQGKYHLAELNYFQNFEKAMNNINLIRLQGDPKRIKEYVHTLEKYFQLFYYELLNREKEKKEEDRINKFLYALHEEVGVTIPYVKYVKGKRCRSTDYNKEINMSELNSSNNQ